MDREPWESINACLKENGRLLNENIRLVEINAALLEALEVFFEVEPRHRMAPARWITQARAAIAQAKGESND